MIKDRGLTQEGLKLIACVTMLIDHIGAVFVPGYGLRIIGRLAFPIYCFLLAEGMARTRNVKKYGIRLAIGAVLSEVPFDLLFFGGLTWEHHSVMVTLLLGYLVILSMQKKPRLFPIVFVACAAAAELLGTDYGALGVLMMVFFAESQKWNRWIQVMMLALLCWMISGGGWWVGPVHVPVQIFGVLALIPISFYNGTKGTSSKAVQWCFYLFYPVHLTVLLVIAVLKDGYLI